MDDNSGSTSLQARSTVANHEPRKQASSPGRAPFATAAARTVLTAIVLFAATLIAAFTIPSDARQAWLAEAGPVETGSIALHLAGVVLLVLSAFTLGDRGFAFRSAFILLLFAAREADFHNRFTTEGIFRTSYYIKSGAPLTEKIAVVAFLVFVAYVLVSYLTLSANRYLAGLRRGTAWVFAVLLGLAFLVGGKALDASTGLLRSVGSSYEPPIEVVNLFEETTELVGAAMLFGAVLLYMVSRSKERRASGHAE